MVISDMPPFRVGHRWVVQSHKAAVWVLLLCGKYLFVAANGGGGHNFTASKEEAPAGGGQCQPRPLGRADRKPKTQYFPLCLIV